MDTHTVASAIATDSAIATPGREVTADGVGRVGCTGPAVARSFSSTDGTWPTVRAFRAFCDFFRELRPRPPAAARPEHLTTGW